MSITLRLDVPALERLIGGDSAIEVELRQGVVEEFARRHLTAILKDEAFAKFLSEERKRVGDALQILVDDRIASYEKKPAGTWGQLAEFCTIRESAREKLREIADRVIEDRITKAVESKFTEWHNNYLLKVIQCKIDALTLETIQKLVKDRLAKIAEAAAKS